MRVQLMDTDEAMASLVVWVVSRPLVRAPDSPMASPTHRASDSLTSSPLSAHPDMSGPSTLDELAATHAGSSRLSTMLVGPMSLPDLEMMLMETLQHQRIDPSVLMLLHGR